jgi:hypothetical protein
MTIKCPRCGEEAENGRFYCGSCGQELQPTELPGEDKRAPATKIWDIDSRAITVALMGIAVSIVGFMAYTFGGFSGAPTGAEAWLGWSGLVLILGFCMIGVGVFMNWSQDMPKSVRFAIGTEVVSGMIGLAVCLSLIMQITSWEWITSPTGQQLYRIPIYDHREAMIPMLVPLVLCPFAVVLGLWIRSRVAWAAAVLLSIANIPLIAKELPNHAGAAIAALMAGIQVVFLVTLITRPIRSFFLKSSKAKNATPAP